jgi:hypothetical protein
MTLITAMSVVGSQVDKAGETDPVEHDKQTKGSEGHMALSSKLDHLEKGERALKDMFEALAKDLKGFRSTMNETEVRSRGVLHVGAWVLV